MFASLPMYDLPEVRPATDTLWRLIRERLFDHGIGDVPVDLVRGTDPHEDWLRDDLVLSQTCGLPFVRELQGRVQMLGSPSYDIDCGAGGYYSVFVARDDNGDDLATLATRRFACNDYRSQSGYAAWASNTLQHDLAKPEAIVLSGAHLASANLVARGEADLASIDAVTWALGRRHHPALRELREVGRSVTYPALPFITSIQYASYADVIRQAISEAVAGLPEAHRDALLLTGFVNRSEGDYQPIADAWSEIEATGYGAGK